MFKTQNDLYIKQVTDNALYQTFFKQRQFYKEITLFGNVMTTYIQ